MGAMRSLGVLRAQLEAAEAGDHGDPVARQRHVDAACELIVALVDELEDEEADTATATMLSLVQHAPHLEIETRRRLARELLRIAARERAVEQLRAARVRAREIGLTGVEADIARELDDSASAEARVVSSTSALADAARQVDDPELASAMERSLAKLASGDEAIEHARKSVEHAREAVDPQLVADATSLLCELLVDRGELAEARQLLDDRPLARDSRADRALYDEIRRRLGEYVPDPPDEPDQPMRPEPAVLVYITKPHNLAQSIIDGALPDSHKIREAAAGTLYAAADLDSEKVFGPVRSFWCACGRFRGREYAGMCCHRCGVELIHAASRRTRIGCILLEVPAIHPWYAAAAGALLDEPAPRILATPVDELRDRLAHVELDALVGQLKHAVVTAPMAKLADQAGRRLAVAEAFRTAARSGTTPQSILLDVILVVPPNGELGFDRTKVRDAYARILEAPGQTAITALFDAFASQR